MPGVAREACCLARTSESVWWLAEGVDAAPLGRPGKLSRHLPAAMGLAALEVMQAVQRTWTNAKVRTSGRTRLMQWRDMFDIAVKWRRYRGRGAGRALLGQAVSLASQHLS